MNLSEVNYSMVSNQLGKTFKCFSQPKTRTTINGPTKIVPGLLIEINVVDFGIRDAVLYSQTVCTIPKKNLKSFKVFYGGTIGCLPHNP